MRKRLFYNFRPLILASEIDQTTMFFQSRFLDLLFLIFVRCFSKIVDFGIPFKIRWDPKWQPKSIRWRQNARISKCRYAYFAFLFQSLFSRNHSNPCAVGASWLFKSRFCDVDWLLFCFRCFSLCFVLYNILNTFIQKKLSKRPAVELFVF